MDVCVYVGVSRNTHVSQRARTRVCVCVCVRSNIDGEIAL